METIVGWAPFVWLVRIALSVGVLVALLYMARFLRPRNITLLLRGELPHIRAMQVLGAKVELVDAILDEQVRELQRQVDSLTEQVKLLRDISGREDDDEPWKQ